MVSKIYKLVIGKGPSPRWGALPEAEQNALWEKVEARFKEVGGERILNVDSLWSAEEYPGYFVEIYPDIEALQKFTAYLNELKFLQYFDVRTIIGDEVSFKPNTQTGKEVIYKLVVAKGQMYRWNALSKEESGAFWEKVDKRFKEVGGERVLWVDSSWANEEYPYYFVEVYPNLAALETFTTYLNDIKFPRYFDVMTVVGRATIMG